jgi:hypothetical protein
VAGTSRDGCRGHPGYNTVPGPRAFTWQKQLGNRADDTVGEAGWAWSRHTLPGTTDALSWTDQQALEHAFYSSTQPREDDGAPRQLWRSEGTGLFGGNVRLLQNVHVWEIKEGQTVLDFLRKVMDRRRSAGLGELRWTEIIGDSLADLKPYIFINDQIKGSLTYQNIAGSEVSIKGAEENSNTVALDLVGDHRTNETTSFQIVDESFTQFTGVESFGDPIDLIVTLSADYLSNGLEASYTATEASNFDALNVQQNISEDPNWGHVYTTLRIKNNWGFSATNRRDAKALTASSCDFALVTNKEGEGRVVIDYDGENNSPLTIRISGTLPLGAGFDFTPNPTTTDPPARFDGDATTPPASLPAQVWRIVYQDDDPQNDRFVDAFEEQTVVRLQLGGQARELICWGNNVRPFEGNSARLGSTNATARIEDYYFTLNLESSNRLRFFDGDASGKIKRMDWPGHRLVLAHNGAILALDTESGSNGGYPPKYVGAGETAVYNVKGEAQERKAYILRDDRDELLHWHKLAVEWYTTPRRTATWQLLDTGFDSWTDAEGNEVPFPKLGQLVTTATYAGHTRELNTPITMVEYDHDAGVTKWLTSWSNKDWRPRR